MFIREANIDDKIDVLRLLEELENQTFDKKKFNSIFEVNLDKPDIYYFVAVQDEKTIAFMSIYINELLHHCQSIAEIQEFIVTKNFQSQKIGTKFIAHAESFLKSKGICQLELSSNQKRLKAHSFYLRNDFKRSHYKFVKTI